MNIREHLGRIEEQLKAMNDRQDRWFSLLEGRIPGWDEGEKTAKDLDERRPIWDAASVKVSGLIAILTSGAVIGLAIAGIKYIFEK